MIELKQKEDTKEFYYEIPASDLEQLDPAEKVWLIQIICKINGQVSPL